MVDFTTHDIQDILVGCIGLRARAQHKVAIRRAGKNGLDSCSAGWPNVKLGLGVASSKAPSNDCSSPWLGRWLMVDRACA